MALIQLLREIDFLEVCKDSMEGQRLNNSAEESE